MTRVLRFSFPYPSYISYFYERHPELVGREFSEQNRRLKLDFFPGATDSLLHALEGYGYETFDVAISVERLQRRWAEERGLPVDGDRWNLQIARAQAIEFRPEVLFVDPYAVPPDWLWELRQDCRSIRLVVCRYSAPRKDLDRFHLVDLILSGDGDQVAELAARGLVARYLHHGFDPRVLELLATEDQQSQILFVGQLIGLPGFHLYRMDVIEHLLEAGLPLHVRAPSPSAPTLRARGAAIRNRLQGRPKPRELEAGAQARVGPPLFGVEMFAALRNAKVTLNVHGDVSRNYACNLRLWEATGVGSCLLTDQKNNMSDLFVDGEEVVTFSSPEDSAEKARWLLDNDEKRKVIAARGQARTLADHTYSQRARELDAILRERLAET